jgi:thiamine biosynthesis lipoprotein
MSAGEEASSTFACFGSSCAVFVRGDGGWGSAQDAVATARGRMLEWHERFSRFLPDSELSRFNRDPRREVPVTPLMARLAEAVSTAGALSGGLVDATLLEQLASAGYSEEPCEPIALERALALAPPRRPARAAAAAHWREIEVVREGDSVARAPGVMIDSGGLAKGMFADVLAEELAGHASFAVNCAGDLTIGGRAGLTRAVNVASPFDGHTIHTFELARGGVATSGIGRRRWLDRRGRPAHHLLDPASGEPAFTGIVQVTALAPDALTAEIRAKAAILSGPRHAPAWLPDGGVIVFDDGSNRVLEPPAVVTLEELASFLDTERTLAGALARAPCASVSRRRRARAGVGRSTRRRAADAR